MSVSVFGQGSRVDPPHTWPKGPGHVIFPEHQPQTDRQSRPDLHSQYVMQRRDTHTVSFCLPAALGGELPPSSEQPAASCWQPAGCSKQPAASSLLPAACSQQAAASSSSQQPAAGRQPGTDALRVPGTEGDRKNGTQGDRKNGTQGDRKTGPKETEKRDQNGSTYRHHLGLPPQAF